MELEDAVDRLYRNKTILAPMVRAGTLPFRTLALRYGADTVFTEEVIDRRVLNAVRTENPVLGTVDYIETRGKKGTATPFQTCALERGRVVYQIGTGDAANALRAAQHVERDVAAVDINMGCPKRFSLQGGMGAALLKRPEVAADVVGTLRRNLSVPVSVKIRLLDSQSETVEFARRMEKAGACALTVHVRRVEDKPASKARWEDLRPVVDAVNIPVIANGDVYTRADMADLKSLSGCSSVMLARPALLNCSVFKRDGKVLPLKEVIKQYLRECFRYDSVYQNAKYTVMEMLTKRRHPDHLKASICLGLPADAPGMREVTPAKTLQHLAALWDVGADYDAEIARRRERAEQLGDGLSAAESVERSCIHKFDDAYFLEPPEAAKSASLSSGGTPDPTVGNSGSGGGGGGGGNVDSGLDGAVKEPWSAAAAAAAKTPVEEVIETAAAVVAPRCVEGGERSSGDGGGVAKGCVLLENAKGEREEGGEIETVVARADRVGGNSEGPTLAAGAEARREGNVSSDRGLAWQGGRSSASGCQGVAAAASAAAAAVEVTAWKCPKRPREEDACGALL